MDKITVNGHVIDWEENLTVRKVLREMNYVFKMLVIKVNGTLVKREKYDTFVIPKNAEVKVIHLISGG